MLKKILLGVAVLVVALLVLVATRPSTYRVERSADIAASTDVVFARVNDFHGWAEWSPWDKRDPQMKRTYEGPTAGLGAIYGWSGNDQVGEGKMTITESKPNERIAIKLEFLKPYASTNTTEFAFKPEGNKVTVAWSMVGNNDFMGKAMSLFMDFDKMIGPDFEQGLATLKKLSEDEAQQKATVAAAAAAAPAPAADPNAAPAPAAPAAVPAAVPAAAPVPAKP